MHLVKKARYLDRYRFLLTFCDDSCLVVDLEKHIEGRIFEPLREVDYFAKGKVNSDLGTICWPNGADFSPDFLREIGTETSDAGHKCTAHRATRSRKSLITSPGTKAKR